MDKRLAIKGIFWILDNGAKWKDLPSEFGSKSAVHRHFQRWVSEGAFERLRGSPSRGSSGFSTMARSGKIFRRSSVRRALFIGTSNGG